MAELIWSHGKACIAHYDWFYQLFVYKKKQSHIASVMTMESVLSRMFVMYVFMGN